MNFLLKCSPLFCQKKIVAKQIASVSEKIQCVASNNSWINKSQEFGTLQTPNPWDYADNVDTMKFLMGI